MNSRQERIQLLARINRGRAAAPSFLASLSEALGDPVDANALASPPQSDVLLEAFRNGYQNAISGGVLSYRRFFSQQEVRLVFQLADCLADRMLSEHGFLLTKLSTDCGAVRLKVSILLKRAGSIIDFDGDSLSVISPDRTQGLLIDHNPDDYDQTYEAVVWGDHWSLQALECDP